MEQEDDDITFEGTVTSYSHVNIKSLRYGATTAHRGKSARYAYIDHRIPVEIQYIFQVEQACGEQPPLVANIAIVRHFQRGDDLPMFPWDLWCAYYLHTSISFILT